MTDIPITRHGYLLLELRDKGDWRCMCDEMLNECRECFGGSPCSSCRRANEEWSGELCTGDGYRWMPGTPSIYGHTDDREQE